MPRGHRQTEPAPTCGKGPAGGAAFQAPSRGPTVPPGRRKVVRERTGPRETLPVTAALAREALRVACASAGPTAAATQAGPEVLAPRPAPSPTSCPSAREPGPPPPPRSRLGPQSAPRCPPPHALRVTHPGARQQQRQQHQQQPGRHGEDSGLAPGPAGRLWGAVRAGGLRTGRGRRDDSAAAAGLQRTQS